jgi:hypothetical protein
MNPTLAAALLSPKENSTAPKPRQQHGVLLKKLS